MNKIAIAFIGSALLAALPGAAMASVPLGVPGPLAGAGLPALAVAGGALWLVRKFSNRQR